MKWTRITAALAVAVAAGCSSDRPLGPSAPGGVALEVYAAGTVTVQPTSTANVFTEGWFGYGDRLTAAGLASIATAPATQALGNGSLRMANTAFGWEVAAYANPAVPAATPLSAITALSYSTYTPSGQVGITVQHVALQFTVDYDLTDASQNFQGRLIFEPYNCNAVVQDAWQNWNTLAGATTGCWWQSANPAGTSAPVVGGVAQTGALACPIGNPCTWSEVMTAYPNAGFHGTNAATGVIFKVGSAWVGTFYTDNLVVGVSGTSTTYDFEPANQCTTTCYVNAATGDNAFGGDTPTNAKKTIQAGATQVSVGGSVIVAGGTYNERIVIAKTLSLLGAGIDVSTVVGTIGGAGSATIQVTAAGVVIDGFTITRAGNNVTDWNGALVNAGVAVQGQTNSVELRNSELTGLRTAIDINNSNGNIIRGNVITDNRTGIVFRNQTDNTIVENNTITNNWTIGVLFLDGSGGTNSPPQSAAGSSFNDNDISGNWYGQVEDRQAGGSIPAPGTNLKDFTSNWWGAAPPVVSATPGGEPGYATMIPVAFGGAATPPGGQPDIRGVASANITYLPFYCTGTDGSGAPGFQPSGNLSSLAGSCDPTSPVVSNVSVTPNPAPFTTASYTLTATATDNVAVTSASYTLDGGSPVAFTFVAGSPVALSKSIGALTVGVHELCVTAQDAAANISNTECTLLAVYDPNAGFVTGGGWIMSPAGAFVADADLTGKATFGFVSKYVKGKTTPTGNTAFEFHAGGLDFSSDTYDWLIVNQGGMNAQFKGTGTLNGVPGYEFMVWAKDGSPDTFRIKISTASGTVVYDNNQSGEFGTTLGGGSIMIHIPKK